MWDGQHRDSLAWALGLSVVLHLLLALTPRWVTPWLGKSQAKRQAPVEVEILSERSQNPQNQRSVVRFAPAPETLKRQESEDPLVFLSEQRQRVSRSQRAELSGKTENSRGQSGDSRVSPSFPGKPEAQAKEEPNQSLALQSELKPVDLTGLPQGSAASDTSRDSALRPRPRVHFNSSFSHLGAVGSGQGGRPSRVGELLSETIPVGEITALNTDRFSFYSFFARIEDMIRPRWESRVRLSLGSLTRQDLSISPSNRFVTQLRVVLDREGNFLEAQLLRSSGLTGLDLAAIEAFRTARVLPNPPQGMIEADGKVRLNYSFTVFVDPRRIARP